MRKERGKTREYDYDYYKNTAANQLYGGRD